MCKRNANVNFKIRLNQLKPGEQAYIRGLIPQRVHLSKHAQEQAQKRGIKLLSSRILDNLKLENIIDVQVDNSGAIKMLARFRYAGEYDLVIVITLGGVVVTCWLNHRHDTHKTLKDKHLYTTNIDKLKKAVATL